LSKSGSYKGIVGLAFQNDGTVRCEIKKDLFVGKKNYGAKYDYKLGEFL